MASTLGILKALLDAHVELVLVGGLAGSAHGISLVTVDLDVCAPLTPANCGRIVAALRGLKPRFRMVTDKRRFPEDPVALEGFKNLHLTRELGEVDILTEITGIGPYDVVAPNAVSMQVAGMTCRVLDIDSLIVAKKALGRPKDLQAVTELEAIRERIRDRQE